MKTAPSKLSRREREVAALVAQGLTSREIGQKLFISERTAEGHVQQIREKLGFRSRSEIAAWVARAESMVVPDVEKVHEHAPTARPRPARLNNRSLLVVGSALALLAVLIVLVDTVEPRFGSLPIVQPIRTFAGTGNVFISDDGKIPSETDLIGPSGIAISPDGAIYFSEGNRIRKVGPSTAGLVVTVAGTGVVGSWLDGDAALTANLGMVYTVEGVGDIYDTAEFEGLAVDAEGSLIFPDTSNDRIGRVTPDGKLKVVAGGGALPGHIFITGTKFSVGDNGMASDSVVTFPRACAVDEQGNLYIADTIDNRVRKVDHATGLITTIAGTGTPGFSGDGGPGELAELNAPQGLAVARDGTVYIADTGNERIRRIKGGVISTVAGTGSEGYGGDGAAGTSAQFDVPLGLALDSHDNLYIADSGNDRVRKLDVGGRITTVVGNGTRSFAGDGGSAAHAELAAPVALAIDPANNLYIADSLNNRIRVVSL